MKWIARQLAAPRLAARVGAAYLAFLLLFFGLTVISYYLLPEGLLKNKHPLHNWTTSPDLWASTMQIWGFNLISVLVMQVGNLFARRISGTDAVLGYGYYGFYVQVALNAVVLGTWSFSMAQAAVPLGERIVRTFDLAHRAGLWEMSGQLLAVCATARRAWIVSEGKTETVRPWAQVRPSAAEAAVLLLGVALMFAGAYIESAAILAGA